MDSLAFKKRAASHASSTALMLKIFDKGVQLRWVIVNGGVIVRPVVLSRDSRHFRVAESCRGFGNLIKHGLKIEVCATKKRKHVSRGGLLFQRFVTLAAKPCDLGFLIIS
jgi:hypothetical protein